MKIPNYDKEILGRTARTLNRYIEKSNKCIVVDWRGYEEEIINEVMRLLPRVPLSWKWNKEQDDLIITYGKKKYKGWHTMSVHDRYITIRKLNEILTGKYEIRGFCHTLEDDTHCFYVKSCRWWKAMEEHFPTDIERVFAKITPEMDFPDYR
ncbi:MAG: hypothetical protein L0241_32355 [Planctomycetia bacterium]|nr:hypothetical protein [Planctomycetia bacterium]